MVGEAKESKDVVPMVLALYGLSLASFLGFMFSLHKYYEESLKEIQLQELSEEDTTIIENSNFDELLETNASSATLIHSSLDK